MAHGHGGLLAESLGMTFGLLASRGRGLGAVILILPLPGWMILGKSLGLLEAQFLHL